MLCNETNKQKICYIKGSYFYQKIGRLDKLIIKTKCGTRWAGTNNLLSFKFCSNGECCSISGIRLANGKNVADEHPVGCTTPDKFEDSQLGSCKGNRFNPHVKITGKVSYSTQANTDGWHGEWIKLISKDGITFKCAILGWIDGNSSDPKTQDFICKVKV